MEMPPVKPKVSGPFNLDPDIIADIEKGWIRTEQLPLREIRKVNLDFIKSPLKVVEKNGISYPADRLRELVARSQNNHPVPVMNSAYGNYTTSPQQFSSAVSRHGHNTHQK